MNWGSCWLIKRLLDPSVVSFIFSQWGPKLYKIPFEFFLNDFTKCLFVLGMGVKVGHEVITVIVEFPYAFTKRI